MKPTESTAMEEKKYICLCIYWRRICTGQNLTNVQGFTTYYSILKIFIYFQCREAAVVNISY